MKYQHQPIQEESKKSHAPFFEHQHLNVGTSYSDSNLTIQRKCAACEKEEELQKKESTVQRKENSTTPVASTAVENNTPASATPSTTTLNNVPGTPTIALFIVEDNALPEPGQMRKSEMLARLKSETCATVNRAMAGMPFTADNCPYINAVFARHQNSSPAQLEALINRYEPATRAAKNAEELIRLMMNRVYTSALKWALNGGNPAEASGMFGSMLGNAGSVIGSISSGMSNLLFKENTGGASATHSPQSVMQQLGTGQPLESSTRSKMENAFGTSFSGVELHTDNTAGQLSGNMNARAFTVGNHIAFAPGEYQPGNLVSDALLAHELAHTIQQQEGRTRGALTKGADEHKLETDADNAAVNAVVSGLSGIHLSGEEIPRQQMPKLKSGLKLQSCRRTVKQCPRGLRWSVVGLPAATGPVCVCTWRCLPPGKGYSVSSYSAGDSSGPSISCTNKDRYGRCPGEPDYETVGSDYEITDDTPGTVIGVGAHMSPLGEQAACGCLPLDIDGDAAGSQQVQAPLLPPGLSVTDFSAGMGARKGAPPSAKDPKPKPAIIEPAVPRTPTVTGKPPAVAPVPPAIKPPVSGKPPVPTTAPPLPKTPVAGKPPAPATQVPATALPPSTPTPVAPGPITSGEALTVPYKKSMARATVIDTSGGFVKIKIKSKSSSGDITQSIPTARFQEMLKSGEIIRWTAERQRLMDRRPDYAPGQEETVWREAVKRSPDGIVRDPNTKEVLTWDKTRGRNDQWHMGHKKGEKYSDLVDSYVSGKISWDDFIKKYQDPANYKPEKPIENMSHKHE